MKLFFLAAMVCAAQTPQLLQVRSVYILPMGKAMDQFLANRLTRFGKMQVVTDPQHADAVLTDGLGESFEKTLDDLYGSKEVKAPKETPVKKDDKEDEKETPTEPKILTLKDEEPTRRAAFARGRGTFFIVDRKTRDVVWSTYERPRNGSPDELNRTADRVVNNLKRDLKPAQPNP